MRPHHGDERVTLWHGDALEVLRSLADSSVDSVVTDPPYGLEFMGKDWDAPWKASGTVLHDPSEVGGFQDGNGGNAYSRSRVRYGREGGDSRAFGEWCELWTAECLRVLKPGGHLLAFGGTRTWHRLACAVEDAGFEVRDSIAWLYGSGFPKSLDVSKAIDKAAGAEREVIAPDPQAARRNRATPQFGGDSMNTYDPGYDGPMGRMGITAPATPDAAKWAGFGTALKPSFEPVVVARKPLASPGVNVLEMVESQLRKLLGDKEIRWTSANARGAAKRGPQTSSSSTGAPQTAATSADPADASGTVSGAQRTVSDSARRAPTGEPPTSSTCGHTAASKTESCATRCSPPTEEGAPAATSSSTSSSPSTTSKEAEPHTERQSTERSTRNSDERGTRPDTESFAGIATGLTGSRAHVLIERLPDGSFVWPEGLPRFVKGGPLTVAATVLAHGTGALNVDACRVGDGGQLSWAEPRGIGYTGGGSDAGPVAATESTKGRWPANVLLDDSQAAELDRQGGESRDGVAVKRNGVVGGMYSPAAPEGSADQGYGGEGGASRFFPTFRRDEETSAEALAKADRLWDQMQSHRSELAETERIADALDGVTFRYEAKAPSSERPRIDGIAHPTVKPLDLMRWLVRLVTPPGGTVLEPFAGSGTTVEAAIVEGFHCIAIEREADYLPLIMQRINRRLDPVAAIKQTGDDLGLFDLEGLA